MTESQSFLFRKILDLNWDLNQEVDVVKQWEMIKELSSLKHELRNDMGSNAYDKFMENGRKMFSQESSL